MEYKLIIASTGAKTIFGMVDYEQGASDLAKKVEAAMAEGWMPQGGVVTGMAAVGMRLLQAMVRGGPSNHG